MHVSLLGNVTPVCVCFQAAHYLHEEAARYPRKIHYHNPPDLAMEALEVSSLCSHLSVVPDEIFVLSVRRFAVVSLFSFISVSVPPF